MTKLYNTDEIIAGIKQNDRQAFTYLYANYCQMLLCIISRAIKDPQVAEDILQEVFINIWLNIDKYNGSKGNFSTWVIKIAKNKAIDYLRGGANSGSLLTDRDSDKMHTGQGAYLLKTDRIGMAKMVMALAPLQQTLIHLVFYKGYTHPEIAAALNMPLGTVKTRVRNSVAALRKTFGQA